MLLTVSGEDGERQEAVRLDVLWACASGEPIHYTFTLKVKTLKDKSTHVAGLETGGTGSGMTSEQSMRSSGLWPTTASLAMAVWKLSIMSC